MLLLAGLLVACGDDEPNQGGGTAIQVKPEEQRTVLVGASDGKLYNMKDGSVYATLTGCTEITDMAMHGEDYYVAGKAEDQATYWVNGEAVRLSDSGPTYTITRSFDNVYATTAMALYRNGIKVTGDIPIEPVAMAAYGENYYVAGQKDSTTPALWTKNGITALDNGGYTAHTTGIDLVANSQGTTHYISGYQFTTVNGTMVMAPCVWLGGTLSPLPLNFTEKEKNNHIYQSGQAYDVAHYGSSVYVVGYRADGTDRHATVWVSSSQDEDEVETYWQPDGAIDAEALRVLVYGSDVYVMTIERERLTNTRRTRIWMNHQLKGTINGIAGVDFVVI